MIRSRKRRGFSLALLASGMCATGGCTESRLAYDFIWGGVSVLDRQKDDQFTDAQLDKIAAHATYVFFSEFHGGWNHYKSLADARRIKAIAATVKVCMYWKPSTIVSRSITAAQRQAMLDIRTESSKERQKHANGDPYVSSALNEKGEQSGIRLRDFVLRDREDSAIRSYNNPNVFFLDVRNPDQRTWIVDSISEVLQGADSPFDCVALDSMNLIGGGNPTGRGGVSLCPDADSSFLDLITLRVRSRHPYSDLQSVCRMRWFWQARLGLDRYETVVNDYNEALLEIINELQQDNPDKEIIFNGIAEKDWRYDRNLVLLFPDTRRGADGALDEDFCIAYRRRKSAAEPGYSRRPQVELSGLRAFKSEQEVTEDWELMKRAAAAGKKLFLKTNLSGKEDLGRYAVSMAREIPQIATIPEQKSFCHAQFLVGAQRLAANDEVWATYFKFGDRYRMPKELEYRDPEIPAGQFLPLLPAASNFELGAPVTDSHQRLGNGLYCRSYEHGTVFLYFGDDTNPSVRFRHPGIPVESTRWSADSDDVHTLTQYGSAVFSANENVAKHGDCRA